MIVPNIVAAYGRVEGGLNAKYPVKFHCEACHYEALAIDEEAAKRYRDEHFRFKPQCQTNTNS